MEWVHEYRLNRGFVEPVQPAWLEGGRCVPSPGTSLLGSHKNRWGKVVVSWYLSRLSFDENMRIFDTFLQTLISHTDKTCIPREFLHTHKKRHDDTLDGQCAHRIWAKIGVFCEMCSLFHLWVKVTNGMNTTVLFNTQQWWRQIIIMIYLLVQWWHWIKFVMH